MNGELRELVRRAVDVRTRELVPYVGNNWDDLDDRFLSTTTVRRRDRAASRRPNSSTLPLEAAVERRRPGAEGPAGGLPTPGPPPGAQSLSRLALERGLWLHQLASTALTAPDPA